jgi:hypothetical protein
MLNDTYEQAPYASIDQLWSTVPVPPLSRIEAARAAKRIFRHFGSPSLGGPSMTRAAKFSGKVRRCWISTQVTCGLQRGWQRLVHDVSHEIFALRHPSFRPHAGGHATLERQIAAYVIHSGWLDGRLRPKVPRIPSKHERREKSIERTECAIARWDAKRRRADNALKKLRRRYRSQMKRFRLAD